MSDQSWEEYLAKDTEHKQASDLRDELLEQQKGFESNISKIQWNLLCRTEAHTKLEAEVPFTLEDGGEAECERLQSFLDDLQEEIYTLYTAAAAQVTKRSVIKAKYDEQNQLCHQHWMRVRAEWDKLQLESKDKPQD